jgi:hypothetical protein
VSVGTVPVWLVPTITGGVFVLFLAVFLVWLFIKWNKLPAEGAARVRTSSDTWVVPGSPDDVLTRTIERARDEGAILVNRAGMSAEMGIGSDSTFRTWGVLFTPPLRLPMRFTMIVTREDGGETTRVSISARSDLGWYAADWKGPVDKRYTQAFAALFELLRRVSGSVDSAVTR